MELHKNFYLNVRPFLKPHGSVLVLEDRNLSSIGDFEAMIIGGDLEVISLFDCMVDHRKYYIWCKPRVENTNHESA